MKTHILPGMTILVLGTILAPFQARAVDKGTIDPQKMNETELLAQVRQLTEEKFELTQFAAGKATKDKVKQFAQRTLQRSQQIDTKLNDLAASGTVTAADKDAPSMPDDVSSVERMQGEAVDSGYVKAMINMDNMLIPLYEQLDKRAGSAKLRDFAHEALSGEHTQLKELQDLNS